MLRIALLAAAALCCAAQQKQRDLRIEKDVPPAKPSEPAPVRIPRSYALVVGIAQYPNLPPAHQLHFPERDAEAMYSILISPEGGNFRAENVHRLIGPKAALADLRRELEEWLPSAAKDDDRVLIYFAGHGFVFQGKAYLAPYDVDPRKIAATGYPMDTLGTVIGSRIKAKWKVLITDSCHSGAINPDADVQAINRGLQDLSRSLFSLTASRDRERSYESPEFGGGHGVFTYYVVKAMEGASDENRDGIVTADELAEYVRRNVREATGGKQNPTSERGSFDPAMLLAYVPSNVAAGGPPPPKFGTLVFESNMDGVEVFLDGKSVGLVSKSAPLRLPGLPPGVHTIKAVKMGYEPDGPREETVYPGQESTVTIKILIPRGRGKIAGDLLDKGLDSYNKGNAAGYRQAADYFTKALEADPKFSQAALYLARTYNALIEEAKAEQWFRRAIEIDPDYLEARASFAGMLLDVGNLDEAVRQLNLVLQRDPNHAMAQYLLAQALCRKEVYADSIEAARRAIRLTPNNGEAHFWLAESLRMSRKYGEAKGEYAEYLRLSDFDSKLAGKLNYYVLGYLAALGKKKRAGVRDIWKELRSQAYFGLCECERKLSNPDGAIGYCRKALAYDPNDPLAHYLLGLTFADKGNASGSPEYFAAAARHFRAMLDLNSELAEAEYARKNVVAIEAALRSR